MENGTYTISEVIDEGVTDRLAVKLAEIDHSILSVSASANFTLKRS